MSKSSSSKFVLRNIYQYISSNPPQFSNPNAMSTGISHFLSNHHKIIEKPFINPWISNSQRALFSSSPLPRILQNPSTKKLDPDGNLGKLLGFRYFSFKSGNFGKNVLKNPVVAAKDTAARYKGAVGLQIEAFWKRNSLVLFGAVGVMVCILLWRVLFGIASTFIGLSEGMAKYGFLALSSAIVAFAGLYLRSRFTINPDKVYRMAMRRLNTEAGILEVMGAPLSGTDLRAYVMSGGGVTLKNFKPRFRGKRCFLIFPIRGSERKGLVSVEVKNKKGEYDMKLLAVDIPMASGPDQRLFLIGDEEEYRVGGGLIAELRDPVVKAMAATKEFEDRDELEDEEDAERELQEAERRHREEIEKLEKGDSR
ncbi:PREDICTED: uncharacterized protein LOC109218570 [Nicotiana attenuata]|uniref:Uncharacterized protein n=1 Tax=Nicotiana attenuata TaxID=49451 RepID=A0A1J6KRB4_NICAT|nr:PREDICTED: uncharacterized protein LOC109218570 [Nicotiana attenuata]OIT21697.1 hypothetical protein A4A49_41730 [Nicotiana attenuata]